ncbi:MAG: hypothetical protein HYT11_03070 [Candidatus Levybacteria bacterium]|nr:hypothetical protein [Candidatus Levybacteria bacterium]
MINKKIALSGLSILASLSLMLGATYAFFSSTATSTDNVFGTGTLELLLDDVDDTTPATTVDASFGDSSMAPGDETSGFISMHNDGSIDIAEVNLGATETVSSSPDLAGKLNITSAKIDSVSTCDDAPTNISGSFTTLAALNSTDLDLPGSGILAGGTRYLCMTFELDEGTDDTYQGKSITETFTFIGHQDLSQ